MMVTISPDLVRRQKRRPLTDVVIPARNEQDTIAEILGTFLWHPDIDRVFLVIDPDTTDDTETVARRTILMSGMVKKGRIIRSNHPGKGQCVRAGLAHVLTPRVIFFDADLTGITPMHVTLLAAVEALNQQVILVPATADELPLHAVGAWQWVSGERSVPTKLAKSVTLHGYLMEEQLNRAANAQGIMTSFVYALDLFSRFAMTEQRLREMERDREWGILHGVFSDDNY